MTKAEKDAVIAAHKKDLVETGGCCECGRGRVLPAIIGFERYWCDDPLGWERPYEPRRFVFRYTDPRASDVPVSSLSRDKTTTLIQIREALTRCVILCRSCANKPEKDDTQCQESTSEESQPASFGIATGTLLP